MNQLSDPRLFRIFPGRLNRLRIDVVALDIRIGFQVYIRFCLFPCGCPCTSRNQVPPFFCREGPFHSRRHPRRHHGRFNRKSSRSAERIDENAVRLPRRQLDQRRRKGFGNRGNDRTYPVASFMKRIAGRVDADRHDIFLDGNPQRIGSPVLFKPGDTVMFLHALDHRFFHDALDI